MGAFSKLMGLTFATLLTKPFTKWKAFEMGLIDEKGKTIRKPENQPERDAIGGIKSLVLKVKRLLLKFVPDNRALALLITTYLLAREGEEAEEVTQIRKLFDENLSIDEKDAIITHLKAYTMLFKQ